MVQQLENSVFSDIRSHIIKTVKTLASCRTPKSKRGWRVYPQNPGFGTPWISPAMWSLVLEIKAIPGFQPIVPFIVEPNLKLAAQNVEKFLTFVSVGFAAAAAGLNA